MTWSHLPNADRIAIRLCSEAEGHPRVAYPPFFFRRPQELSVLITQPAKQSLKLLIISVLRSDPLDAGTSETYTRFALGSATLHYKLMTCQRADR
jgi:hypothetical protein